MFNCFKGVFDLEEAAFRRECAGWLLGRCGILKGVGLFLLDSTIWLVSTLRLGGFGEMLTIF